MPETGAQLTWTSKNDMNTDIWSLRPWKYSGSSTSWMMTTFPSAGAVILRPSPAGLRLGSLKKQMKNTANPIGMQKSIQYRTFGAPKYHDVPPRSTAKTSAISIVTAPSLCIFMTLYLYYSPNNVMYRTVTGNASSAPSNRSSSPPCPGMMRPASLTPKLRFNWDSRRCHVDQHR